MKNLVRFGARQLKFLMSTYLCVWVGGGRGGWIIRISSDGDYRRILFFGKKIWQVLFGMCLFKSDFFGVQDNLKIRGSACVSIPPV